MNSTRRDFLKVTTTASGALLLGIDLAAWADEEARPFAPSAWLSIRPDGTTLVRIGKSEMGQGVRTSLPMIVAEELGVDLGTIAIEQASPGPEFQRLGTGGSGSIMRLWDPLREAGATARTMLVEAAARRWRVPASECMAENGRVRHRGSSRMAQYRDLVGEAARLSIPEEVTLKEPGRYELIGQSRKRIDGTDIVTGRATYGIDVRLPGMRHAVMARRPFYGASLGEWNADAALAIPGVEKVLVVTRGLAVVATNTWAALRGRDALNVEWLPGEGSDFSSKTHLRSVRNAAVDEPGLTIHSVGDGADGLEDANEVFEALYEYGHQAHAPVEPVNSTALVEENRCTIWSPTQTPNTVQRVGAHVTGLDQENVEVRVQLIGGGFGRRLGHDFDFDAVEIANQMKGTPIQLLWTREDDMKHGYFQAASAHKMFAGLSPDGRIETWVHRKASSLHNARAAFDDKQKADPDFVRGFAWGVYDAPYAIPNMQMSYRIVEAPVLIGPWRAVFSPPSVFARESFIDELAQKLNRDPIDLRLELLGRDDVEIPPTFEIDGDTTDRRKLRRVLEQLESTSGWNDRLPDGRARGIACNVFHTETYVAYAVEVSRRPDAPETRFPFSIDRVTAVVDCGLVVNPNGVRQQVESGIFWSLSNMKTEITFEEGRAQQAYFTDYPVAMIDETPGSLEVVLIDSEDPRPHGVGEPVVCPFAPAVANAISRLTGTRVRRLPIDRSSFA